MAKAYLGSTQLKKAYIGSTAIKKIYRGSTLIWAGYQDETLAQKVRIEADGGTIIDLDWIDLVISTLKTLGIYSNCKLLTDANFGVKKDITGAVSKLYDISGNNNDAVQATGASQPIWSLVNGKGVITYDGSDDWLCVYNNASLNPAVITISSRILPSNFTNDYYRIISKGYVNQFDIAFNKGVSPQGLSLSFKINGVPRSLGAGTGLYNIINSQMATITFDGDKIRSYRNSVLGNTSISYPGIIDSSTNNIGIGSTPTGGSRFVGQINSSAIFNIALTQEIISILLNLGL